MKANEIQIGNWLYYKGQFNAFPFKVESITKKKVGYHAEPNDHRLYYLRLSECKPIPLTPEILEKNGFTKLKDESGKQRYRWEYADGIHISIDFTDTDPWVHVSNRCYFAVPYCEYVHQLQHALRLCGIEKEIRL